MKIALVKQNETIKIAAQTGRGLVDLEHLAKEIGVPVDKDPFILAASPLLGDLEGALAQALVLEGEWQMLPPIPRGGKVLCMALNYQLHAAESGHQAPEEPIYFAKASSSLVGEGAPIVIPGGVGRVDPEAELGVVMGKRAKSVSRENALDYVAGYTCFNDVTARDLQSRDLSNRRPWFRCKSFDTFGPVGPFLVTKDEIADPDCLAIRLTVNGEVRQDSNTSQMIFDTRTIIAAISQVMSLEPGDIIATGTPEGIAPIFPGDTVTMEVEGVGTLVNPVIAEK